MVDYTIPFLLKHLPVTRPDLLVYDRQFKLNMFFFYFISILYFQTVFCLIQLCVGIFKPNTKYLSLIYLTKRCSITPA